MILLHKKDEPKILESNGANWTKSLLSAIEKGEKPTNSQISKYNHVEIKEVLLSETNNKCAYCESKIRHISHGDIEHVIPKSKRPDKAFEWNNLTIACSVCNQRKGNFYSDDDTHDNLIDPYSDDPKDHFLFLREIVTPNPTSMRVKVTEEKINLMRNELIERRRERIDFVDGLVSAYFLAPPKYKAMLKRDLDKKCLGKDKEYSAVVENYIKVLEGLGVFDE